MSTPPVFRIRPTAQSYDWGKPAPISRVYAYAQASQSAGLDVSKPYAELWMGTHPTSPSKIYNSDLTLADHLKAHPELLGGGTQTELPFLFKVLAINKALSIQSHPDKKTAERLFETQPHIYKDPNHKPELALALTPFSALCGFLPLATIRTYLLNVPEFASLIPPTITETFLFLSSASSSANETAPSAPHILSTESPESRSALKDLFSALMTAEPSAALSTLIARYKAGSAITPEEADLRELVLTLNEQFPGDIGIFCVYVLNYVKMQPGEAIFLSAGEPHAYVSGDIIECMANSDNVIRAGLTPKLRDLPNLLSTLTYAAAPATKHIVQPYALSTYSQLYAAPVPEFDVIRTALAGGAEERQEGMGGPSVLVVTQGKGSVTWAQEGKLDLEPGTVFFVGAGTSITVSSTDRAEEELVLFRAYAD